MPYFSLGDEISCQYMPYTFFLFLFFTFLNTSSAVLMQGMTLRGDRLGHNPALCVSMPIEDNIPYPIKKKMDPGSR